MTGYASAKAEVLAFLERDSVLWSITFVDLVYQSNQATASFSLVLLERLDGQLALVTLYFGSELSGIEHGARF